ncbi:MAG TPA: TIGR03790 family protein [Kiritimatiellia bacterium]|nr:TIGR03790 family protein [Kiritimatiellia bacterium]HMP32878.1 TIGR03790 family protein [Kiritimatiellia bacterium]
MNRLPGLFLAVLMIPLFARGATLQEIDARQTVVLANARVPASVELARYYMERRGIPTNHLCVLDLPDSETMARWYYENTLRAPLQTFLRERGLIEQIQRDPGRVAENQNGWRTVRVQFRYLVLMPGVPLRIAETRPFLLTKLARILDDPMQRDGAAVDSELALMLWDQYDLRGVVSNPHYNLITWPRGERQLRPVLITARLDGPSPETVRGMIDSALAAERTGLHGRVYIDTRSVRDPNYAIGDFWMREAAARLHRLGLEVVVDRREALFGPHHPMEDAALYLGWYNEHVSGPFASPAFRFRPGAIAYHLHSFSARSVQATNRYWAGPLLARGAAAVMGAVDEPYLDYTPDLQVFTDRLATGHSFGESAYFAQRALSWQMTVVGDPLYRPFLYAGDQDLRALMADPGVEADWEIIRRMNLVLNNQQFNLAIAIGREAVAGARRPLVQEKLAELFAKNELWDDAIPAFRSALEAADNDRTAIRIAQRFLWYLRAAKRFEKADRIEQDVRHRWPDSPFLPALTEDMP